ncbi:hypothetical protein HID58_016700 [Brassica napus]|uniref:Uncharacterized protein n=1 Tax=Brassica napus TaxID=3708 RepID=A0ABQ7XH45_BRANA|nr:hypothetical protein HID58_016700 [Brassica napus]
MLCLWANNVKKAGERIGVDTVLIDWNVRSNPNFFFGDATVAIRYTDQTVFVDLAESIHRIPRESFRPTHALGYHDHNFARSVFIWQPSYNCIESS